MAVEWSVIEIDDMKPFLAAAQVEALDKSALGTWQGPRFEEAMPRVAARVRGKIASAVLAGRATFILSATENSVPPELFMATVFLLIQAIQPGLQLPLTEDQKGQIAIAEKDLDAVAAGKLAVSEPIDPQNPSQSQAGGFVSVVHANCREATRDKMRGI
jgi:hypothetical protein